MEDIIAKLGWKKTAAILVVVSLIGIGFVMISFSDIDKKNSGVKKGSSVSDNTGNTNIEITKTPQQKSAENSAKTYRTPYYQVSYPENYESTLYEPGSGELSTVALLDKANQVRIEISVFDAKRRSLESLSGIFKGFGFTQTDLRVRDMNGMLYSGIVKGTKVYESVALFQKDGVILKLQLIQSNGKTPEVNDVFLDIINSLE